MGALSTKAGLEAARRAAVRAAGFANATALHDVVIGKGYLASGMGLAAFNRAQAYWLHIVQPLGWAAEAKGPERRQWVRTAHRGAFVLWANGHA